MNILKSKKVWNVLTKNEIKKNTPFMRPSSQDFNLALEVSMLLMVSKNQAT